MILTLFILCVLAVLAALLLPHARSIFSVVSILSTAIFAAAGFVAVPIMLGIAPALQWGFWYLDPFASTFLLVISFLQWTATLASVPYLGYELHEREIALADVRRYFALLNAFVLSMMFSVSVNNLGLMWVALEATTLATTLLVAFYPRKGSLEAAWKYIVLCSTGISLGLIGLLLTYNAASGTGGSIDWTYLLSLAPTLSPGMMKLAFIFVLIGYGTKVGLVPMHAWLPDAHSRAPAPISALLSGVLLNAALFSIIRYKMLVDGALHASDWTNWLLLFFGVLSCIVPAAFILIQTDYKRLLAYSSIEHMGITTMLFGLGPVGTLAAIIHLVGHALIKSMLFFGAGNILLAFKSTKFERVGDVLRRMPYTGGFFLFGLLALLAVPPSPLFLSEVLLFSGLVGAHPYALTIVALALALIGAGFFMRIMPMLFSPAGESMRETREGFDVSHAAMALHAALVVAFGFALWSGGLSVISFIASSIH